MNGVSQLRELYAAEARDVSEPADVMARVVAAAEARPVRVHARRRPWRGWLVPVAASTAVAAVAALAVGLAHDWTAQPSAGRPAALPALEGRPFRYTATVDPPAGYQVSAMFLLRQGERVDLVASSAPDTLVGSVTVYAKGAFLSEFRTRTRTLGPMFDPGVPRAGQPTTVNGHPGYLAESLRTLAPTPRITTLGWQFEPGSWAVVQVFGNSVHENTRVEAQLIAEAVDPSRPHPALLPFHVGYLPSGLRRCEESDHPRLTGGRAWQTNVTLGAAGDATCAAALTIRAVASNPTARKPLADANLSIDGKPAHYEPASSQALLGGTVDQTKTASPNQVARSVSPPTLTVAMGSMLVTITGRYPKAELVDVAQSMSAADLNDRSSWFDAGG